MDPENEEFTPDQIKAIGDDFAKSIVGEAEKDPEEGLPLPSEGTPPVSPAPPPIDPLAQILADDPLPKAWKKETEPLWVKADKELRAQIKAREADVSRGIQMYGDGYKAWDAITKPFEQVIKAHPSFGPEQQVQLFQNLMGNHLALISSSGEAKIAKVKQLLTSYGVDLVALTGTPSGNAPAPAVIPPEFQAQLQKVNQVEATVNNWMYEKQLEQVNAFFADPKNEYALEVAPVIQRLIESGQAKDVRTAYEQAIWLDPTVRAKIMDKEVAERNRKATEDAEKARRLKNLNRGSSDEPGTPAAKKGSVDDTINGVLAKHLNTH